MGLAMKDYIYIILKYSIRYIAVSVYSGYMDTLTHTVAITVVYCMFICESKFISEVHFKTTKVDQCARPKSKNSCRLI